MRNTRKIIESIVNYTNFNPALKAALESLYENNVDIVYWNALNEAEDKALEKKIKDAVSELDNLRPKSDIAKPVDTPEHNKWISNQTSKIENKAQQEVPKKIETEEEKKKRLKQKNKEDWRYNPYATIDADMGIGIKYTDSEGEERRTTREEAERLNIEDDARQRRAYTNAYYSIIDAEERVGAENIKRYMEKISDDVQTFVSLVMYLVNQIIKEAWVNSPETIKKVYGDKFYDLSMETPALALRGENISSFIKESSTLLKLAQDLSVYLLLGEIKNDVSSSLIDVWDDVKTKTDKKVKATPLSKMAKEVLFDLGEGIKTGFYKELEDAIWESLPIIIETHGDNFFLIIESQSDNQHDAFMSSALRSYNPLFETLYEELSDKKPFNWLLELEEELNDARETDKNLTYSASMLVKQGIASQADYSFPIIGGISGMFSHNLLQTAYKNGPDGFSKLLDVRESLWITSSYVPGMHGLILMLMNIASGILFVATAEDIVPFDMSKTNPEFTELPIWKSFREGALDIKGKYKEQPSVSGDRPRKPFGKKVTDKTSLKGGLIKKYFER
jgi:hypothetical protein